MKQLLSCLCVILTHTESMQRLSLVLRFIVQAKHYGVLSAGMQAFISDQWNI